MPGSKRFTINEIRDHLPETIHEIEFKKWEKIRYLLQKVTSEKKEKAVSSIKDTDEINLLKLDRENTDKNCFVKSLCEGAQLIKGYIKADTSDVYLIDEDKITRIFFKQGHTSTGASWNVGPGTISAAYVAFVGETLLLEDFKENKLLYPYDPQPLHMISIPILSENQNCVAVFEFSRIYDKTPFAKAEVNLCSCMVGWLGESLIVEDNSYTEVVDFYNLLFTPFNDFLLLNSNSEKFISDVLSLLHDTVKMEKVNYYQIIEVEPVKCKMIVEVAPRRWEFSPKYEVKKWDIINEVVKTHSVKKFSKQNFYSDAKEWFVYFESVDSAAFVPIGVINKTTGVIELINKENSEEFSERDISVANRCGIYCAAALQFGDMYFKVQIISAMNENLNQTLAHHLLPCLHELNSFKIRTNNLSIPSSFFKLTYYPSQEEFPNLPLYSWFMFKKVFKIPKTDEAMNKYMNFILMAKKGYRNSNSYHNFEHAFNVCHSIFIITQSNTDMFTELERKAILIAALTHDIDHPGKTNKFMQDTEHPLAKLYSESFLEYHHSSIARLLIQECGLFSELDSKDFQSAIKLIDYCILSTDLSTYFTKRYILMDVFSKTSFNPQDQVHRKLFLHILMSACDLSGQGKSFKVAQRLCRNLYKEFYDEADCVRKLENEPISVMNIAHKLEIPKYQIQFNTEVCIPCFYILSLILQNTDELRIGCCYVCEQWDKIIKSGSKWDVLKEEQVYYF